MEAGSLGIGTSPVSRAGPLLSVQGVSWHRAQAGQSLLAAKPYTVYNLTVEDDHTFSVGNAGGGTWVHNGCVTGDALKALRREFDTVAKPAYWRNKAETQPVPYSPEALERMVGGKGFIGEDGFTTELHHVKELADGGTNAFSNLVEMSRTAHRLGGNLKLNHPGLYP